MNDWLGKKKEGSIEDPSGGSVALTTEQGSRPSLPSTDFVQAEVNLETALFDSVKVRRYPGREIKNRKGEVIETTPVEKVVDLGAEVGDLHIVPTAKYGFPNVVDQDLYRGLQVLLREKVVCSVARRPDGTATLRCEIPQPFCFSNGEVLRAAGWENGGPQRSRIRNWIKRLHTTALQGNLKVGTAEGFDVSTEAGTKPLITDFLCVGDRCPDGSVAEMNYLSFAPWFLANYKHQYLKPLDVAFHRSLENPISKGLYPLLDRGWYAANGGAYEKRYSDLCGRFGIRRERYLAEIKRQLNGSHNELTAKLFLSRWEYRKSADRADWIVSWWPGEKWFRDREGREELRRQAERILEKESLSTKKLGSGSSLPPATRHQGQLVVEDLVAWVGHRRSEANYWRAFWTLGEDRTRACLRDAIDRERRGGLRDRSAYLGHLIEEALGWLEKQSPAERGPRGQGEVDKHLSSQASPRRAESSSPSPSGSGREGFPAMPAPEGPKNEAAVTGGELSPPTVG